MGDLGVIALFADPQGATRDRDAACLGPAADLGAIHIESLHGSVIARGKVGPGVWHQAVARGEDPLSTTNGERRVWCEHVRVGVQGVHEPPTCLFQDQRLPAVDIGCGVDPGRERHGAGEIKRGAVGHRD